MKQVAVAVVVASGAWLAEESADSIGPISRLATMILLPLAVAIIARRRPALAIILALLTLGAAQGGRLCFQHAYNSCVGNAGSIKSSLDGYRRANGRYPATLTEAMPQPPCKRCLRGTILRYSSDGSRYVLSFSDSIVSWETTDQTAWSVGK